jgi:hypothetical protein
MEDSRIETLIKQVYDKITTETTKNEVLYRMFFPNGNSDEKSEFDKITTLLTYDILEHFEVSESDKNRVIMYTSDYKSTQEETIVDSTVNIAESEKKKLELTLNSATKQKKLLEDKLKKENTEKQRLKKECDNAENKIINLQDRAENLLLKSKANDEKQRLEGELETANNKKKRLESEFKKTVAEKTLLEGELKKANNKKKRLESELETANAEKPRLEGELETANAEKTRLETENKNAETELKTLNSHVFKNETKIDELKRAISYNNIKAIPTQDQIIENNPGKIAEQDQIIENNPGKIAEQDQIIENTRKEISDKIKSIKGIKTDITAQNQIIENNPGKIAEQDQIIENTSEPQELFNKILSTPLTYKQLNEEIAAQEQIKNDYPKKNNDQDQIIENTRKKIAEKDKIIKDTTSGIAAQENIITLTQPPSTDNELNYINGIYCLIYDYNNIKYYINYNKAVSKVVLLKYQYFTGLAVTSRALWTFELCNGPDPNKPIAKFTCRFTCNNPEDTSVDTIIGSAVSNTIQGWVASADILNPKQGLQIRIYPYNESFIYILYGNSDIDGLYQLSERTANKKDYTGKIFSPEERTNKARKTYSKVDNSEIKIDYDFNTYTWTITKASDTLASYRNPIAEAVFARKFYTGLSDILNVSGKKWKLYDDKGVSTEEKSLIIISKEQYDRQETIYVVDPSGVTDKDYQGMYKFDLDKLMYKHNNNAYTIKYDVVNTQWEIQKESTPPPPPTPQTKTTPIAVFKSENINILQLCNTISTKLSQCYWEFLQLPKGSNQIHLDIVNYEKTYNKLSSSKTGSTETSSTATIGGPNNNHIIFTLPIEAKDNTFFSGNLNGNNYLIYIPAPSTPASTASSTPASTASSTPPAQPEIKIDDSDKKQVSIPKSSIIYKITIDIPVNSIINNEFFLLYILDRPSFVVIHCDGDSCVKSSFKTKQMTLLTNYNFGASNISKKSPMKGVTTIVQTNIPGQTFFMPFPDKCCENNDKIQYLMKPYSEDVNSKLHQGENYDEVLNSTWFKSLRNTSQIIYKKDESGNDKEVIPIVFPSNLKDIETAITNIDICPILPKKEYAVFIPNAINSQVTPLLTSTIATSTAKSSTVSRRGQTVKKTDLPPEYITIIEKCVELQKIMKNNDLSITTNMDKALELFIKCSNNQDASASATPETIGGPTGGPPPPPGGLTGSTGPPGPPLGSAQIAQIALKKAENAASKAEDAAKRAEDAATIAENEAAENSVSLTLNAVNLVISKVTEAENAAKEAEDAATEAENMDNALKPDADAAKAKAEAAKAKAEAAKAKAEAAKAKAEAAKIGGGTRKKKRQLKNKTYKKKYNVKYMGKRHSRKSRKQRGGQFDAQQYNRHLFGNNISEQETHLVNGSLSPNQEGVNTANTYQGGSLGFVGANVAPATLFATNFLYGKHVKSRKQRKSKSKNKKSKRRRHRR